jgi:uncharacterized protein (TIGR00297 family)
MREVRPGLEWQSKAILLIVVPWTAISVLLQSYLWAREAPVVAWWTLGISGVFGLVVWRLRAGTLGAAATGAAITASLMYSTVGFPYESPWLHGGLLPLLTVFLLTFAATKIGKAKKERIGTAEAKRGRNAAQVAANLGMSALVVQSLIGFSPRSYSTQDAKWLMFMVAIAALAEAAADTVSSEIGQVFGGKPRLLTTLRPVDPGVDGGVTFLGTAAGVLSAIIVTLVGAWIIFGGLTFEHIYYWRLSVAMILAAIFGLLFDSLLGATLEYKGLLNNDAVNFLSTLSSVIFALLEIRALAAFSLR